MDKTDWDFRWHPETRCVKTHGYNVDDDNKKMSKKGNESEEIDEKYKTQFK